MRCWSVVFAAGVLAAACAPECEPVPPGALGALTPSEEAFLAEGGPSAPPAAFLEAEDGLGLAYADWLPEGAPVAAMLFVHGSSAHGALYAILGKHLAERGLVVRVIDLRGHGLSRCGAPGECGDGSPARYLDDGVTFPGRVGDAADEHQLVRDLGLHLAAFRGAYAGLPTYLGGHSGGAGLVARAVETGGARELAGLVLLAPFNHADQPQNEFDTWECGRVIGTSYARVSLGAVGDALRGNVHRYVLSLDKPEALTDPLDTLRYTYTMMRGLAVTDADTFHAALALPTLWIAARHDALLGLEPSRREYERLPQGAGFVVIDDASHVGVSWSPVTADAISAFVRR